MWQSSEEYYRKGKVPPNVLSDINENPISENIDGHKNSTISSELSLPVSKLQPLEIDVTNLEAANEIVKAEIDGEEINGNGAFEPYE